MAFYGDPAELDRLARRIRAAADQVWDETTALSFRSATVEWASAGAEQFRRSVDRDVTALRGAAAELEEAAAVLAAHAETVRERLAAIARIEAAVTGWFGEQAQHLERLASRALDAVADAVMPGPPPWHGWRWTPSNLPPPGDKLWLEVGAFMSRRGVL